MEDAFSLIRIAQTKKNRTGNRRDTLPIYWQRLTYLFKFSHGMNGKNGRLAVSPIKPHKGEIDGSRHFFSDQDYKSDLALMVERCAKYEVERKIGKDIPSS